MLNIIELYYTPNKFHESGSHLYMLSPKCSSELLLEWTTVKSVKMNNPDCQVSELIGFLGFSIIIQSHLTRTSLNWLDSCEPKCMQWIGYSGSWPKELEVEYIF